jgi:hypothetical protein
VPLVARWGLCAAGDGQNFDGTQAKQFECDLKSETAFALIPLSPGTRTHEGKAEVKSGTFNLWLDPETADPFAPGHGVVGRGFTSGRMARR